jgi:hypothetical protein
MSTTISTWVTTAPAITNAYRFARDTWIPGDPFPVGPVSEAVFLILNTFWDNPAVQPMYSETLASFSHFGLNFENETRANISMAILAAQHPTDIVVIGSWYHDSGRQQGLIEVVDESGEVIAIYGEPVYPLNDAAYEVIPNALSNDDLIDINLIAGQHPRLFFSTEGPL